MSPSCAFVSALATGEIRVNSAQAIRAFLLAPLLIRAVRRPLVLFESPPCAVRDFGARITSRLVGRLTRSAPRKLSGPQNQRFADSRLEGDGFELLVPRHIPTRFNQPNSKTSSSSDVRDEAWLRRHRVVRTCQNPRSPMPGSSSRSDGAQRTGIGWSGCSLMRSRSLPAALVSPRGVRAGQCIGRGRQDLVMISVQTRPSVAARGSSPGSRQAKRRGIVERCDNADLSSQSRFCTVLDRASARNSRPQPRSGARVPYLADRYMTRATGRVSKTGAFSVERGHPLLDLAISSPATRPQVAGIISVATRPEQVEQNVAAARWLLIRVSWPKWTG